MYSGIIRTRIKLLSGQIIRFCLQVLAYCLSYKPVNDIRQEKYGTEKYTT